MNMKNNLFILVGVCVLVVLLLSIPVIAQSSAEPPQLPNTQTKPPQHSAQNDSSVSGYPTQFQFVIPSGSTLPKMTLVYSTNASQAPSVSESSQPDAACLKQFQGHQLGTTDYIAITSNQRPTNTLAFTVDDFCSNKVGKNESYASSQFILVSKCSVGDSNDACTLSKLRSNPAKASTPLALYVKVDPDISFNSNANSSKATEAANQKPTNNADQKLLTAGALALALYWSSDSPTVIEVAPSWSDRYADYYRLSINGRAAILAQDSNPTPFSTQQSCNRPAPPAIVVELFKFPPGCREYQPGDHGARMEISRPINAQCTKPVGTDNGITVGATKIFDTFGLRNLLTQTANQLATIAPINGSLITSAYGNLQGVQSDASYLAAQIENTPAPSVSTTTTTPSTNTQTTTPLSGTSTTTVTANCPSGYIPSIGTNNTVTCTAATTSLGNGSNGVSLTSVAQPASGSSTVVTSGTQSTSSVVTAPSVTPTIPAAPASNAFTPPTNTGLSASNMLDLQMQLSAQITMIQMLLQGASSDQLLADNGRAVAFRRQTTIALPITLRPPAEYKHAAAEVRVLMVPRRTGDVAISRLSVVNLLPSVKTYNVARISSKQRSFGAAAAIQPVSAGITGGKSRNRLYIGMDSDTISLQYPTRTDGEPKPVLRQAVADSLNHVFTARIGWFDSTACGSVLPEGLYKQGSQDLDNDTYDLDAATMFGWQFRPVLGNDHVDPTPRIVFAQIALPSDAQDSDPPPIDVYIQTLWRDYSPSGQVAGAYYVSTCQWQPLNDSITISNRPEVQNVEVLDTSNGVLRVRAEGEFLSNSLSIRSGANLIPPQIFGGSRIEFFENAIDILHNGDLELVNEDGSETRLVVPTKYGDSCSLIGSELRAIPRPDGSALVRATLTRGKGFQAGEDGTGPDGPSDYKVLIGPNVYNLLENPFITDYSADTPTHPFAKCQQANSSKSVGSWQCSYDFIAPTATLRSAQTYLVRDIAWDANGRRGTISFGPSFSAMTEMNAGTQSSTSPGQPLAGVPAAGATAACGSSSANPCWYQITGNNLQQVANALAACGYSEAIPSIPGNSQTNNVLSYKDKNGNCTYPRLSAYEQTKTADYLQVKLNLIKNQSLPCVAAGKATCPAYGDIRILDDSTLILAADSVKTLHLVWQETETSAPVDWAMTVKKQTEDSSNDSSGTDLGSSSISANPTILYVNDTRTVAFTGSNLNGYTTFVSASFYDGTQVKGSYSKNTLKLEVPPSATIHPGTKEISVTLSKLDPVTKKTVSKNITVSIIVAQR